MPIGFRCPRPVLAIGLLLALQPASRAGVPTSTAALSGAEPQAAFPGGDATQTTEFGTHAFSQPSANMTAERRLRFRIGKGYFKRVWTAAPASNDAADGLGPLFNARTCQSCHPRNGRGRPPGTNDGEPVSMFLRLSIPPRSDAEHDSVDNGRARRIPEPTYGTQLQERAIPGIVPEGRMIISYQEIPIKLDDGETIRLRHPRYSVANPGYGPMAPDTLLSPRVAPQLIGLGLLDAIAETDILSLADPEDTDSDGISGCPNLVWSPLEERLMPGRFGWRAAPSVDELSQRAFNTDMGISVPLHPAGSGDCTDRQSACRARPRMGTARASAASRRGLKGSSSSPSTRETWQCQRGAHTTSRRCWPERRCSTPSGAPATITPGFAPRRCLIGRNSPTN